MITLFIISGKISQSPPYASTRVSVQPFSRKRVCPPPDASLGGDCTVLYCVQYSIRTIPLRLYSSKCVAKLEQVFRIRNP